MTAVLGRLERVDLREVWTHEATSFTPWLAREDNLRLLGDAIGSDLTLESQEQNVGPFRADILCKDAAQDHWVLIENQIERTDHGHLGQLITYAAGLHAVTVVWIAARFTDEHRAALDWLNEVTNKSVSFFGLEVELWRIGNSPAAPKFNVVSKPNTFVKEVTSAHQPTSQRSLRYLEYWQAFKKCIDSKSTVIRSVKPSKDHWSTFAIGRSGFTLIATAGMRDRQTSVSLILQTDPNGMNLQLLRIHENELNTLAPGAIWNEKPGRKESAIDFTWRDSDPNDEEQWPPQHERMLRHLEILHSVFATHIRSLP